MLGQFYEKIARDIKNHKQSVVGVAETTPFHYTIGNKNYNLPDLLTFGMPLDGGAHVLNRLAEIARQRTRPFTHGELVSIGGTFPVKIVTITDKAKERYTVQAGQFYDTEDYTLQQVITPDKNGKFPGDEGCEEPYASMPVLTAKPTVEETDGGWGVIEDGVVSCWFDTKEEAENAKREIEKDPDWMPHYGP